MYVHLVRIDAPPSAISRLRENLRSLRPLFGQGVDGLEGALLLSDRQGRLVTLSFWRERAQREASGRVAGAWSGLEAIVAAEDGELEEEHLELEEQLGPLFDGLELS